MKSYPLITNRKIRVAIVGCGRISKNHLKLNTINLQDKFNVVLGGDDVQKGKPEPDIYLMAAEKLQMDPSQCIAIEDSPGGISAAVDACIYTIAVLTESTKNLDLGKANEIIETLEYFDYSLLRK